MHLTNVPDTGRVARRRFIQRLAAVGMASVWLPASAAPTRPERPSADEALALLRAGNLRFQQGKLTHPDESLKRRADVAAKQEPFAMIFACADSRESPELIFDEGLGDLFVIRTAGHVLDQASIGSLEFGVSELNIPLLVVLGHKRCGAIKATLNAIDTQMLAPGSIEYLAAAIRPALLQAAGTGADRIDSAVRANVSLTVQRLQNSQILTDAQAKGQLKIVGGYYDLDTGGVTFLTP